MTTTHRPSQSRVSITIDVHDEPLVSVLIWARRSAHQLIEQLWKHGVLAHVVRVEIDPRPSPNH